VLGLWYFPVAMAGTSDATTPSQKVRVLLLMANPSDTARVAAGEEFRAIEAALRAAGGREHFELNHRFEVRAVELTQALQAHRPHVVHFSGHGSASGELLLPNATGHAKPTRPEDIAELFGILSKSWKIRCVLLNACYTEVLAEALAKHVDCVIGTSSALVDKAAIEFASAFYESLGFGNDLNIAYELACSRVRVTLPAHVVLPRLHHRPEIDPSKIALLPSREDSGDPPNAIPETPLRSDDVPDELVKRVAHAPPVPCEDLVGKCLGRFLVVERLGAGGMGVVYRGRDKTLPREVAIKVLPPGVLDQPSRRSRLKREARALASLNHPNVATLYDASIDEPPLYLVMELVDGITLRQWIREAPRTVAEVVSVAQEIAEGLAAAHAQDIIHRDLKPENVMVTAERAKIIDFGVARFEEAPGKGRAPSSYATPEGLPVGTPAYMSPEQAVGSAPSARSDVFTFGVCLFEMLTARERPYFERSTVEDTLLAVRTHEPTRRELEVRRVPAPLVDVVVRCMQKESSRRYENAGEVAKALRQASDGQTAGRSSWKTAAAMAASAGIVGLVVVVLQGGLAGTSVVSRPTDGDASASQPRVISLDASARTVVASSPPTADAWGAPDRRAPNNPTHSRPNSVERMIRAFGQMR
jgi:serine/threonine protein kinase